MDRILASKKSNSGRCFNAQTGDFRTIFSATMGLRGSSQSYIMTCPKPILNGPKNSYGGCQISTVESESKGWGKTGLGSVAISED